MPTPDADGRVTRAQAAREMLGTDTGRAAGMATAVIATNILALAFTVVFARILGAEDYGSLAALLSAFIILMVPGTALQIVVARQISTALAEKDPAVGSEVRSWVYQLCVAAVAVAVVAVVLREQLAAVINVDEEWAAATVPIGSMFWAIASVERGALQGFQRYGVVGGSLVGEAMLRLIVAVVLVGAGMGVTGAFLGTGIALAIVAAGLAVVLRSVAPPRIEGEVDPDATLRAMIARARIPMVAMTLLFALQEIHVIVVKHTSTSEAAGSWAVAAVAAKGIIWVAVGLGMYLLPEVARRTLEGEDTRHILLRVLGVLAAVAVPMLIVYSLAAEPLLSLVFGSDLTDASGALGLLGLAMAALASAYLAVQYLLALGRTRFAWLLGVAVVIEVVAVLAVGTDLTAVAGVLAAVQVVCAAGLLTLTLRSEPVTAGATPPPPVPVP